MLASTHLYILQKAEEVSGYALLHIHQNIYIYMYGVCHASVAHVCVAQALDSCLPTLGNLAPRWCDLRSVCVCSVPASRLDIKHLGGVISKRLPLPWHLPPRCAVFWAASYQKSSYLIVSVVLEVLWFPIEAKCRAFCRRCPAVAQA